MTRTTLAVFLAVILPTAAAADDRGGRHEVRQDKAAIHDDLRDAQLAQQLLNDFDEAVAERAHPMKLQFIEARIRQALRDELREASRETRQTAHEARRSEEEIERDRRQLEDDAARGDRREFHEDRHELEGDRADAAKDRHDFMMKAEYRKHIGQLNEEWNRLMGRRRPQAIRRKHDILVELVRLSRFEIRADAGEIHEDRGGHRR